jgi:sigma-B regulation protein RsbU (phosphoserine phosphatase)
MPGYFSPRRLPRLIPGARLRWKVLGLLILLGVVPLCLNQAFDIWLQLRSGRIQAGRDRTRLEEDARGELLFLIRSNTQLLIQECRLIETSTLFLKHQAETLLALPGGEPRHGSPPAYFPGDFELLPELRKNLQPMEMLDADAEPILANYQHPVFYLPPGIQAYDVREDLNRLAGLGEPFRLLHARTRDLALSMYISLENGLHCSFPGKLRYPSGYDPRLREWYLRAKTGKSLAWNRLYVDAGTNRVVTGVSVPLYRPDGALAGVAGTDLLLDHVLSPRDLAMRFGENVQSYIVVLDGKEDAEKGFAVAARQIPTGTGFKWNQPLGRQTLTSSDQATFRKMLEAMRIQDSAVLRMPHEGRDSLWAFGNIQGYSFRLLYILPYELAVAEAEQAYAESWAQTKRQVLLALGFVIVVLAGLGLAAVYLSTGLTQPVTELIRETRRLSKGDFEARVDIQTGDELEELADSFNRMVPELKDSVRMKESLSFAKEVQENLLPQSAPSFPGIDLAARSIPCDETGGDYYDFFRRLDGQREQLCVALGDVSGHGIAPSLLMATGRAYLRASLHGNSSLHQAIEYVNRRLCDDVHRGRFMTLFCLLIDPAGKELQMLSAGQDPAFFYDAARNTLTLLGSAGLALGIEPGYRYQSSHHPLPAPGSVLLLGTDGIWEARNGQEDLFGKERLESLLKAHHSLAPSDLVEKILTELAAFRSNAIQRDDITLVVVKFT